NLWDSRTGKLRETLTYGRPDNRATPIDGLQVGPGAQWVYLVLESRQGLSQFGVAKEGRQMPGTSFAGHRVFGVTPDGQFWLIVEPDGKRPQFRQNSMDMLVIPSLVQTFVDHDADVGLAAVSPDSASACTVTADGGVHRIDIKAGKILWSAAAKILDPTAVA